jgi:multicomponent Na+:H+ antiporter subunit B
MNSEIFRYCTRTVLPIMIFFSIFLLVRGHNEPGGGFLGGLVAAASIALYYIAHQKLPAFMFLQHWTRLLTCGCIFLLLSFFVPLLVGKPFLTGLWVKFTLLGDTLTLGTPILFDIGVYLLVVGSVAIMVKTLEN